MTSNNEYFLVFDTNILFHRYDNEADFTSFSFGEKYEKTVDLVNQLDIYEYVTLVIPEVSWGELTKQIEEAYEDKYCEITRLFNNYRFPGIRLDEYKSVDYKDYIKTKISDYKKEIQGGINDVIELPIPIDSCFSNIITRAIEKIPPFEGKEKQSDKGFKDALIWESILKFVSEHSEANLIFYCNDMIFRGSLIREFSDKYPAASISICKNQEEVKKVLEGWAQSIDEYSYRPIENDNRDFIDWLESGDFTIQLIDYDFGLADRGKRIDGKFVNLVTYDNIIDDKEDDETISYKVEVVLSVGYLLENGETIEKRINALIDVTYGIEDVYIVDNLEIESEV